MPASGSCHRCPIASAATAAARHSSSPSMSWPAAAASSDSASPNASSWNCFRTQFPVFAPPPGKPRSRSRRSSPIGSPATVYPGISPGPSASSRSVMNRTAPASIGCGP